MRDPSGESCGSPIHWKSKRSFSVMARLPAGCELRCDAGRDADEERGAAVDCAADVATWKSEHTKRVASGRSTACERRMHCIVVSSRCRCQMRHLPAGCTLRAT